jgi:cell division initiation protein
VDDTQGRGQRTLEISPLDIRNQVFKKKLKGYDPDEVKQFLDAVADRMEQMLKAAEMLEKDLAAQREKTEVYAKMEQTLRDTLLTAQKLGADTKVNAEASATNIIKEAEIEAKKRMAEAAGRVETIGKHRDMIKSETLALVAKVRSLVEAELSFLKGVEEEVVKHGSSSTKGVHVG